MITLAKQLARWMLNAAGLEVRTLQPASTPRCSMAGSLRQLTRLGFKPQTVIDVGVAYGTPELYQEFHNANILLIEPLAEFEPFLREICTSYKAQFVLAAAGETDGIAVLNVHPDKFGSSWFKEVEGSSVDGVPRDVPMVTVDQVCLEKNLTGPYLIKADVQGAELQVLAGATRTLQQTHAVILELTLFGTLIGAPQFYDVISRMKQLGFVVYDAYNFLYRPLDNALCQVDIVFVRERGQFREFHAFATPEQREAFSAEER